MALPIESRLRRLFELKLATVIRAGDADTAHRAAMALLGAGFRAIEITMTVPGAMDVISALSKMFPDDAMLGAGTVLSGPQAKEAIERGAQFVVSPTCETDIIRPCREAGVVAIPAGMTPTEILAGWRAGGHVIKVFPAEPIGGPPFIRTLRGPLPDIPLWVSGGVLARDAQAYFAADVQLVGLGAELLPADMIKRGDWVGVSRHADALRRLALGEG